MTGNNDNEYRTAFQRKKATESLPGKMCGETAHLLCQFGWIHLVGIYQSEDINSARKHYSRATECQPHPLPQLCRPTWMVCQDTSPQAAESSQPVPGKFTFLGLQPSWSLHAPKCGADKVWGLHSPEYRHKPWGIWRGDASSEKELEMI